MSDLFKQGAEVLHRAAELIGNPRHWCTDVEAMTSGGAATHANSTVATAWCLVGSIKRAAGTNYEIAEFATLAVEAMLANDPQNAMTATSWNDNPFRAHGEVIALLRSTADALDDLAHGRPPRPERIG